MCTVNKLSETGRSSLNSRVIESGTNAKGWSQRKTIHNLLNLLDIFQGFNAGVAVDTPVR